jgi:hypothetical protein
MLVPLFQDKERNPESDHLQLEELDPLKEEVGV